MSISSIDRSTEQASKGITMGNVTVDTETYDPTIALKLLETFNTNNRPLRQATVNQYASFMANSTWHFTGDPIQISETGVLLNGQHRLWAVVESGVTIQFLTIRGLPDEVYTVLDSGLKRSMADALGHENILNGTHMAALARHYLGYQRGWLLDSNRMKLISRDEQVTWVKEHHDEAQWAVRIAHRFSNALGRGSNAATSVFAFSLEENVGRIKAEEFLLPVITGVNLQHGDARLALRNWLLQRSTRGARNDAPLQLATEIMAFNRWVKGKKAVALKSWDKGTPFPVVQA